METRLVSSAMAGDEPPNGEFFSVSQEVCSYDGMYNTLYFKNRLEDICSGHGYEMPEGAENDGITEGLGRSNGKNMCTPMSATLRCKDGFVPATEVKKGNAEEEISAKEKKL